MKKLLLTVTYTNSEGKKVKLKDCDVLTNYGDIIYFWNGDKVNKTYVLNVYTMTMREVEYSKNIARNPTGFRRWEELLIILKERRKECIGHTK